MESETFLQHLRRKPIHVRQRMVFAGVILMSPVLFYIWSITNTLNDPTTLSTTDVVRDTISDTFSNSTYEDTFGTVNFGNSQTANSIQSKKQESPEAQLNIETLPENESNDTVIDESASGM